MKRPLLSELVRALEGKRAVVLATRIPGGEQALLQPLRPGAEETAGDWPLEDARRALLEDRSVMVSDDSGDVFLRVYNPPARLVVVGGVHIASALADLAGTAGFDVYIVDPRSAFASETRFPGVRLVREWPEAVLAALKPDHRTAVVTLTHDAKLDEPALLAAIASDAFYIGALGSRRTHDARVERLRARGVDDDALTRIHAPIGLDIGARTPAEIAVSILAEVVARLRRGERVEPGSPPAPEA